MGRIVFGGLTPASSDGHPATIDGIRPHFYQALASLFLAQELL